MNEPERFHGIVGTDPELCLAILRRCQKLDPAVAAPVLEALEDLDPEVVLEAYFDVLAKSGLDH